MSEGTKKSMASSDNSNAKSGRYNIRVLDRAFSLLEILAEGTPRNLVGLSSAAQLDTSTTFRLLSTLLSHGYVARDEKTGEYSVGIACVELAQAYLNMSIVGVALPHLVTLRDITRETVHLAVLDRMEVVYVDKQEGLHAVGIMSSRVGVRNPAYCTGVGKSLLAYQDPDLVRAHFGPEKLHRYTAATISDVDELMVELDEIRDRGFAFDMGEHEKDVRCIAAPVFDTSGRAIAAVSVSGPDSRLGPILEQTEVISQTLSAANAISTLLGANKSASPSQQRYHQ